MIETTATTDEERLMPDPQPEEGAAAIPPAPATARKAPAKKAPAKKAPAKKVPAKKVPAKKAPAKKAAAEKAPAKKAPAQKAPAAPAPAQATATVQEPASPVTSRREPVGNGYRLPVSLGLAAAGLVALVISRIRRD